MNLGVKTKQILRCMAKDVKDRALQSATHPGKSARKQYTNSCIQRVIMYEIRLTRSCGI